MDRFVSDAEISDSESLTKFDPREEEAFMQYIKHEHEHEDFRHFPVSQWNEHATAQNGDVSSQ
jgi:hypothetical protein